MLFSVLSKLPGKKTKELLERYLTIGRFAFHTQQIRTFNDLANQYPDDSGFVILPMDMEYMDAGKVTISYREQMAELARIKAKKNNAYPFVFADPRRIKDEKKQYFDYRSGGRESGIKALFYKRLYIEGHIAKNTNGEEIGFAKFNGFKIYPCIGLLSF